MLLHRILNSLQQTAIYYAVIAGAFFALWLWWRKRPGKRKPLQAKPVDASPIAVNYSPPSAASSSSPVTCRCCS